MSRFLSSAANAGKRIVQWLGYKKDDLPSDFQKAAETYVANGAVKVKTLAMVKPNGS